jgi:NAD(P)H-hydrate epimerase
MHADTGEIFEPHFKAHQTLCVELVKRGLLQFPSRAVCGEVHALPIGIDTKGNCDFELLTPQSFPPIPRRSFDAHKGSFGKVLVIGGSHSMPGAAILAAHASLRSGAGIVRLLSPGVVHPNLWPEIMIVPCADKTVLTLKSLAQTKRALQQSSVVVLGPGLGNEKQTIQYSGAVLKECAKLSIPVVLDADALPALSLLKDSELPELICTPHPGELARLLGHTTEEIQRDRYKACFAAQMACAKAVWVLKGAGTIVFSKSHGYVSPYASPFLATAGSGDVLAGIIAALRAQHIPSTQAAGLGVLLHFETARELLLKGVCPLRAHDLIETIPKVWEQVLYE